MLRKRFIRKGADMNTYYEVQQLLKRFGTIIYTGSRLADLEMMESEIRELYSSGLLDQKDYQTAILVLRREHSKEQHKVN